MAKRFLGGRQLLCLTDFRLTSQPNPAEFVERELPTAPGVRTPFNKVASAFNAFLAASPPLSAARVQALLAGAGVTSIRPGARGVLYVYDRRLAAEKIPQDFIRDQLAEDPYALTPMGRVVTMFNVWWPGERTWTSQAIGRMLTAAGLPASTSIDEGGKRIYVVRGWRLVGVPSARDFRDRLIHEPSAETPLDLITAAFNAWHRSGLPWSTRRVGDLLRAEGFALKLLRREGLHRIFLIGHRLRYEAPELARATADDSRWAALRHCGLADDLIGLAVEPLTAARLQRLAAAGIKTRDGLADLAADELQEIIGAGLSLDAAQAIVMAARGHWFESPGG
ncbi:MAG: hypothetical protein IT566_17305 [Rhodospirillaceae bacterium]|nr:hypothetical protein [Rhodospirillaceae bacterium]